MHQLCDQSVINISRKAAKPQVNFCGFAALRHYRYASCMLKALRLAAIAALRHALFAAICGDTANL
jgi:hypothetical protein